MHKFITALLLLFSALAAQALEVVKIKVNTVALIGPTYTGSISVGVQNGALSSFSLDITTDKDPKPITGTFDEMEQGRVIARLNPQGQQAARLRMLPGFNPLTGGKFRLEVLICGSNSYQSTDFDLSLNAQNQWATSRAGKSVKQVVLNAGINLGARAWRGCFSSFSIK